MAYERKTVDVWEIWSNYGYGWEVECEGDDWKSARQLLRDYNENAPQEDHKLRHRRIQKEKYAKGDY